MSIDFQRRQLTLGLGGLLLAPAIARSAPGPIEKPKIDLAVGGKALFYYLPLTIAERLGYFTAEGLDVTIHDFAGGAKSLQALVGGSADIASGSFEHVVNMHAKGRPLQALVLQVRLPAIVLAMPKARAAKYKSPKDLRGLKIGVTAPGSSTNMFVSNLLAKARLHDEDVSIIGVGTGAGAVAAIKRGDIDALVNLDPVISRLEANGDVVAVVDTRTNKGALYVYGGAYHASCLYATDEFVAKHPNTVQAVVNAMVHALRWLQKTKPEQIVDTVPPEYYGDDKPGYLAALKKNIGTMSPDGILSAEGARNVYQVLRSFEPTLKGTNIDLLKTIDSRYVTKALAKYR
jgi:NitT/TauT family transport system substrate-binding protein